MRNKIIYISIFVLLQSGCSVGPDYKPISTKVPQQYKEAPPGWKLAEPGDALEKGKWWEMFNDPYLNDLMVQVNVSNQNIASAVASYREALATVDQTVANYFPTLSIDASVTRQNTGNSNAATFGDTSALRAGSNVATTYEVGPAASWSPDIFGVVRRAVEAAKAGAQATEAQLAETRLSMQALLAQTYFQLRAADLTQKLLDETVEAYRTDLTITKNKFAAGVDSKLDVAQAETQLQNAMTAALDNGITRAQYEHAIAVLVNKLPEDFSIAVQTYDLPVPHVPLEVPSRLLERRPDIASAERSIAQANANIGVAIAAYFPLVTLTGNYGYSGPTFKDLFSPANITWSVAAAIAETVFDGGARAAQVKLARATYDQKVAAYRQTVLSAFQNVEDNLASVRILDSEVTVQEAAVASANKALEITLNQYNAGIVDYLAVIVEQNIAYTTREAAISLYSRRLVAAVNLIQSLGGGWDHNEMSTAAGQKQPCS